MSKVFVLGIDGAFPEYFFGEWFNELKNIKWLIENGAYARLNSTIPPLSVTAWTSIYTGKSPANTGIFEYIQREGFSTKFNIITSRNLKEKTVWEIISDNNKSSVVCYALLSWPIKPFNGWMISDFKGYPLIAHSGAWVGFRSAVAYIPDQKLWVVIFSNYRGIAIWDFVKTVLDEYINKKP